VLALDMARFGEPPVEGIHELRNQSGRLRIEHPNNRHRRLLRARRERPRRHRAAKERDELASFHSITSSARASRLSGTVRPRAWPVWGLIPTWSLVGAGPGGSAGFSLLGMRSTWPAARRNGSMDSGP